MPNKCQLKFICKPKLCRDLLKSVNTVFRDRFHGAIWKMPKSIPRVDHPFSIVFKKNETFLEISKNGVVEPFQDEEWGMGLSKECDNPSLLDQHRKKQTRLLYEFRA